MNKNSNKNTNKVNNNLMISKVVTAVAAVLVIVISCVQLYVKWNSKTKAEYYMEHVNAGKEYMENECYVEAMHEFRSAELIRNDENVQVAIAECYLGLKDYATFKTSAEQVQSVYGTNDRLYEDLAHYYSFMNDSYSQINTLHQGVLEYPDSQSLRVKYDAVKGEYTQAGFNVDQIISVGENYMVVVMDNEVRVITGALAKVGDVGYDRVYDLSEDKCIAAVWKDTDMLFSAMVDGKLSYYDSRGYKRKSPEEDYTYLGAPRDGFALVQSEDGWGYINCKFDHIGEWFDDATSFGGGMAAVKKDGKWAFVDSRFNYVTEFVYDDVIVDEFKCCSNSGVAFAKRDGGYAMINVEGEIEREELYISAKPFASAEDYAAVKTADGWKLIDIKGEAIEEVECDELCSSANGTAAICNDGKWGYIGVDDGVYVEAALEGATGVNKNGYAVIKKNNQWMIIHFSRFQVDQGL